MDVYKIEIEITTDSEEAVQQLRDALKECIKEQRTEQLLPINHYSIKVWQKEIRM